MQKFICFPISKKWSANSHFKHFRWNYVIKSCKYHLDFSTNAYTCPKCNSKVFLNFPKSIRLEVREPIVDFNVAELESGLLRLFQRYSPNNMDDYGTYSANNSMENSRQYSEKSIDPDPLFYNSRPRSKPDILR